MEVLEERYNSAVKALERLLESTTILDARKNSNDSAFLRDSVIKRFKFTYEAFWKFLRAYLGQKIKLDISTISNARTTFQAARIENVLTEKEANICFNMITDRNQTSHTYDESFAEEVAERVVDYAKTLKTILTRITVQ